MSCFPSTNYFGGAHASSRLGGHGRYLAAFPAILPTSGPVGPILNMVPNAPGVLAEPRKGPGMPVSSRVKCIRRPLYRGRCTQLLFCLFPNFAPMVVLELLSAAVDTLACQLRPLTGGPRHPRQLPSFLPCQTLETDFFVIGLRTLDHQVPLAAWQARRCCQNG